MGFFDFLKPLTPEQKRTKQFEKIKSKIVVRETKSLMHDLILLSPHDSSKNDINPKGTGRFGLDKSNPIPIYGMDNINAYMDKLRYKYTSNKTGTTAYNPISYLRTNDGDESSIGSPKPESKKNIEAATESPNINGAIDVYNIYSISNKKLAKVYINCYSLKTSDKLPEGFYHRDKIPILQDGLLYIELMRQINK